MGTVKVTNIEPIADNGTLTIGNSGDTIALTSGAKTSGFGKIGQVVRNSGTTTVSTTGSSFVELINTSITPTSTTSKILILANVMAVAGAGSNAYIGVGLFRGTLSSGTELEEYFFGNAGGNNINSLFSINTLDEPSTTSSQQYTLGIRKASGATTSVTTDGGLYEIILMEILD